jgi:hypothetical protein
MVPNTQLPAAYWSPISTLRKWAKNPRKNDQAVPRVARSIRKYGFVAPVVVWESQGRLVAGHTRIAAYEAILQKEPGFVPRDAPGPGLVPVRFHEFVDEAEANAYAIADNKLVEAAEWDEQLLGSVFAELRTLDERLLAETGFEDGEIERLIREVQHAPADGHAASELEALPCRPPSHRMHSSWSGHRGGSSGSSRAGDNYGLPIRQESDSMNYIEYFSKVRLHLWRLGSRQEAPCQIPDPVRTVLEMTSWVQAASGADLRAPEGLDEGGKTRLGLDAARGNQDLPLGQQVVHLRAAVDDQGVHTSIRPEVPHRR